MLAPAYPPCFPDAASYEQWRVHAKRVWNVQSTPCDDCTEAYRAQMERAGRCDPVSVQERFLVAGR